MKVSICLLLILPVIIEAQRTPTIAFISPDVVTDIGGDVELTCRIANGKEYPILWIRQNNSTGDKRTTSPGTAGNAVTLSSAGNLYITDPRFNLTHDEKAASYTLKITDVKPTDAATYQCQVIVALHNMITADVELHVKLPPVMRIDSPANMVRVKEGQEAKLECKADGYPSPWMTWRRDDGHVLHSGKEDIKIQTLIVPKVRKEDRGEYVCLAQNGVGEGQERKVRLEVEFAPEVQVPHPKIPQAEGYEAALTCLVYASPAAAIQWTSADGKKIVNSDLVQISHFASQNDLTTSTLRIYEVREDSFGRYTCQASNRHGSVNASMELYESKMPICPPVCGDITLHSAAAAFPTPIKALFALVPILALLH